jgi:hypothetical protein
MSKFDNNLCDSLAFGLASYGSPETLYQECDAEVDGYYGGRLNRTPPPGFARFPKLAFAALSDPSAQAGPCAFSAEQRVAGETHEAGEGGDEG